MATYYVLKIQGKAKIPDYIQVRDEKFTLVGYFRPNRGKRHSHQDKQDPKQLLYEKIEEMTQTLSFGKVTPIEIADPQSSERNSEQSSE